MAGAVALLAGRFGAGAAADVRTFIAERLSALLGVERFIDSLAGHLPSDAPLQARRPALLRRIETLGALPRAGSAT